MSGLGRRPSISCDPRAWVAPARSGMSYFFIGLRGPGVAAAASAGAGSTLVMSCCAFAVNANRTATSTRRMKGMIQVVLPSVVLERRPLRPPMKRRMTRPSSAFGTFSPRGGEKGLDARLRRGGEKGLDARLRRGGEKGLDAHFP